MIKGSIAGAAGVALLLGGAGTFALWNDTAAVAGGTITAGTLTVDAATGTWTDQVGAIEDLDEYLIVPGDTLTYKTVLTVDAKGDNIKAKLHVDNGSIVSSKDPANVALKGFLDEATTVTAVPYFAGKPGGPGPGGHPGSDGHSWDFNLTEGDQEFLVTVTIKFPSHAVGAENKAMNGSVDLNDLAVTLTQYL